VEYLSSEGWGAWHRLCASQARFFPQQNYFDSSCGWRVYPSFSWPGREDINPFCPKALQGCQIVVQARRQRDVFEGVGLLVTDLEWGEQNYSGSGFRAV
jgi:hypothetical protein